MRPGPGPPRSQDPGGPRSPESCPCAPAPGRHNPCAPAGPLGTASTSPGGRRGRRRAHSGRGRAPRAPSRRGACAAARRPGSPGAAGGRSAADREAWAPPARVAVYAAGAQCPLLPRPLQHALSAPAAAPRALDRAAAMGNGMNKVTWPSSLPSASTPQPACRGFAGEGSPARPRAPERRGPPRACVCEAPGPRRFRLVAENSPCPLAAPALVLPRPGLSSQGLWFLPFLPSPHPQTRLLKHHHPYHY